MTPEQFAQDLKEALVGKTISDVSIEAIETSWQVDQVIILSFTDGTGHQIMLSEDSLSISEEDEKLDQDLERILRRGPDARWTDGEGTIVRVVFDSFGETVAVHDYKVRVVADKDVESTWWADPATLSEDVEEQPTQPAGAQDDLEDDMGNPITPGAYFILRNQVIKAEEGEAGYVMRIDHESADEWNIEVQLESFKGTNWVRWNDIIIQD